MDKLSKKLRFLEENVVSFSVTEESCFIDISEAPEAEKQLHAKAQNLSKNYQLNDLTPEMKALIEKSSELLTLRCFLLFRKMIKTLCGLDESAYSSYFDTRLLWFVSESYKLGNQEAILKKIEKENPLLDEDSLETKRIEAENSFDDLWTENSFEKFEKRYWQNYFYNIRKKINCNNPDEVTLEQLASFSSNKKG